MRSGLRVVAALAAWTTLACGGEDATGPASAFASAKARWETAGPASYSFVAFRSCECLLDAVGPVKIVVSSGEIATVTRVSDNGAVDSSLWFTIDGLFDLIEAELARLPERVAAEYDAVRGYPKSVTYGMPEVDAGATITITEFAVPLPPGSGVGYGDTSRARRLND